MAKVNKFWNLNILDLSTTEILIYDSVASKKSYDWWTDKEGDEVTPKAFRDELFSITTPNIIVRINSGGGDIFSSVAISSAIKDCRNTGKKITCKIDGICASAAVQIAMSCESIEIAEEAYLMIHNPMTILWGYYNNTEIKKVDNQLESIRKGIITVYKNKTGLDEEEIIGYMDNETWWTGREAVDKGFCDEIMFEDIDTEYVNENEFKINGAVFDLKVFNKLPDKIKNVVNSTKKRNTKIIENGGNEEMQCKNIQELKNAYPELVKEIENNATESGRKEERTRLQAIDGMQGKIKNEVLNKAKYETFDNAEKVALNAVTNGDFVDTNFINALTKDAESVNKVNGFANNGDQDQQLTQKQIDAQNAAKIAADVFKK